MFLFNGTWSIYMKAVLIFGLIRSHSVKTAESWPYNREIMKAATTKGFQALQQTQNQKPPFLENNLYIQWLRSLLSKEEEEEI
ncbi:hypothetical protein CUMW_028990 [Citrus unshiu]|nr:hypothetical protein CUMW_028990 [Citrus unshiu]